MRHLEKSRKLLFEILTMRAEGGSCHERKLFASIDVAVHGLLETRIVTRTLERSKICLLGQVIIEKTIGVFHAHLPLS